MKECNQFLLGGQADSAMHGVLARISQQRLNNNCPQTTKKEQWSPINSPNSNAVEIPYLTSDERSYFETFI